MGYGFKMLFGTPATYREPSVALQVGAPPLGEQQPTQVLEMEVVV